MDRGGFPYPHAAVAWCISSSSSKARAQGSWFTFQLLVKCLIKIMFFFKRKATSPSTASSAENQIFNHISRFLGSLKIAHLQFMVKAS